MPITKPPAVAVAHGVRSGAAGGGGGSTTFVSDLFTDSDSVLLSAHTADAGGPWTLHPNATGTMEIKSNRLRNTTGANKGLYYATAVPPSADYDVSATIILVTNNASSAIGACGRMSTVADTKYWFRFAEGSLVWGLFKTVAGVDTGLGSTVGDASPGGKVGTLRMVGTAISLLIDGALAIGPITDSAIAAAGRVGTYGAGTSSPTVGVHLDNLSAVG